MMRKGINVARTTDQPEAGTTPEVVTQSGEEYTTRGQVRLATRRGYQFRPSDQSLPVITPEGVAMTREQADKVLEEAKRFGTVYEIKEA